MKNALITGKTDSPRLKPVFSQLQKELSLLGVDSFVVPVSENTDKPDAILEKIAEGKMRKFFEENTLLNQAVVGEKKSIAELIAESDKEATIVAYKRFALEA